MQTVVAAEARCHRSRLETLEVTSASLLAANQNNQRHMISATLPPELWHRVFKYLDPGSLSNLTQVSNTFHRLATEDSLFRHHISSYQQDIPAAQVYRRFAALHYPATTHISRLSSARTEPFAIVHDTLLLCDFERSQIRTFPNGNFVQPDYELLPWDYLTFPDDRRSSVVLPEHHIAFMFDRSPTKFVVMNVVNGDLWTFPVLGDRFLKKNVWFDQPFLPAGNNAEWIAYYVDDTKLVLVDWRSGEVSCEIDVPSGDVKYAVAECAAIDMNCLVGLVYPKDEGFEKEVVVKGFDGEDDTFPIRRDRELVNVLRSADKLVHVLITTSGDGYNEKVFQVRSRREGKLVCCDGKLSMSGYPEIRENGRVLACRCGPYPQGISFGSSHTFCVQLWIEIGDLTSLYAVEIPKCLFRVKHFWTRRTKDGGFILFTANGCSLELAKVDKSAEGWVVPLELRSWAVEDMISVHVVADHYIVVQNRDGKITVFHFDWFCEGATSVYACPGFVDEENDDFSEDDMDLNL